MGPRRLRLGVAAVWAALACSSPPPLTLVDGRYTHATLGATFTDPARLDPRWRLVDLDAANAAFAGPDGAAMSWVRECRATTPEPRWLARTLLVDAPGAVVTQEGERDVDGAPGWELFARVAGEHGPLALHAVIRSGPRCSDDWVLVAPESTDAHEAVFERWRASFADGAGGG